MIEQFTSLARFLPFGYAFAAGMVTTLSPCGIAMLPAYISLYLGAEENPQTITPWRIGVRASWLNLMVTTGFITLFVTIGASISLGGEFVIKIVPWVTVLIGVSLFLLGVRLLTGGNLYFTILSRLASRLTMPKRKGAGFFVFGITYGIAALGCALPIFLVVVGSTLALKGFTDSLLQFLSYVLGMGFIISIVTFDAAFFKEGSATLVTPSRADSRQSEWPIAHLGWCLHSLLLV